MQIAIACLLLLWSMGFQAQGNKRTEELTVPRENYVRSLEMTCVGTLRNLNTSQHTYMGGDQTRGFARSLKQLGPDGEGFVDAITGSGKRYGYSFRLIPEKTDSETQPILHYSIIARPIKRLSERQRSYYTDDSGEIRFTEENRVARNTDPLLDPPQAR